MGRANLAILAALDRPLSIQDLADRTALGHETVRWAIASLEEQGLADTEAKGQHRIIRAGSPVLVDRARALTERPHPAWKQVFHGEHPLLLHVLDRVGSVDLTAEVMGQAKSTIYHFIAQVAPKGILQKDGLGYRVHSRQRALRDLVEEWSRLRSYRAVRSIDAEARLLWFLGPEAMFSARKKAAGEGVHPAGLTAFADHGILIQTGERSTWLLSRRQPTAADHLLQAIRAESESRTVHNYAALLYEAARPEDLLRKAPIYGLEQDVERIRRFVDEQADQPGFLPWSEHERFRELYRVGT